MSFYTNHWLGGGGGEGEVNLQKLPLRQQSRCRRNDNNRSRECSDTGGEKIDGAGGGDNMTDWQKNTFHFRHTETQAGEAGRSHLLLEPPVALGVCFKDLMLCKIHFADKNISPTSSVACVTLCKVLAQAVHDGSYPLWRHKGHWGFAFCRVFAGYFCWITN